MWRLLLGLRRVLGGPLCMLRVLRNLFRVPGEPIMCVWRVLRMLGLFRVPGVPLFVSRIGSTAWSTQSARSATGRVAIAAGSAQSARWANVRVASAAKSVQSAE